VCMTAVSRKKKGGTLLELDDPAVPESGSDPQLAGDYSGLEMRDLVTHVVAALDRLPEKYSSVISMFYVQELSYPEIAEVTGMPVGTVKTHLFRGRILLQKELSKQLHNEEIAI
jgi:RNA polymerase sigma factor (sigma-70 family)